jgi:hypothetical protein
MIDIEQLSPTAHRMVVIEEFRQADAETVVEFVKQQNATGGGGNLLVDLTAMGGFTWSAVTVELTHIPSLMKWVYSLDRIAIVSDEAWVRTAAKIESALLPGVTYEVYDEDAEVDARAYVLGESDKAHGGTTA